MKCIPRYTNIYPNTYTHIYHCIEQLFKIFIFSRDTLPKYGIWTFNYKFLGPLGPGLGPWDRAPGTGPMGPWDRDLGPIGTIQDRERDRFVAIFLGMFWKHMAGSIWYLSGNVPGECFEVWIQFGLAHILEVWNPCA